MFDLIPWRRKREERLPATRFDVRRDVDDLMDRFFGGEPFFPGHMFGLGFSPAIDMSETEDEILVKADVPGIDPDDLKIDLSGNMLTISGEKKEEREEKGESRYRFERSFGSFSRSFTLPCEIQEEKVEAKYKDGVLSLKLPKTESSKKKTVKIEVEKVH